MGRLILNSAVTHNYLSTSLLTSASAYFTPFDAPVPAAVVPRHFVSPFNQRPHPLAVLAAQQLQDYIRHQQDWEHNFGLTGSKDAVVIGKMFGVLVVQNEAGVLGYLSAFSGKLAGANHHPGFVPPVYDSLADSGFLNKGMTELTRINEQIALLENQGARQNEKDILLLKTTRKNHSYALQHQLYEQYHFLNQASETKSLLALFAQAAYKNPPAGAGECAAPKLLQYAFQHRMKPVAIAEFWWGMSPKSDYWQHGQYYPACEEKCRPILAHMLTGLELEGSL